MWTLGNVWRGCSSCHCRLGVRRINLGVLESRIGVVGDVRDLNRVFPGQRRKVGIGKLRIDWTREDVFLII